MAFKFTKPVEEYAKHITPEMLKKAFEEYGFEVELKSEYKECNVEHDLKCEDKLMIQPKGE